MTEQLQKKVNFAIKLLRSIPQDKGDIELCYSGGKDSDVILELAKIYKEPEVCRVYRNKEKARLYFPILEWDLQDVEEFITLRNIKLHPLYYDENNKIDVTRRLGCLGCPLASRKKRIEMFKKYPKMLKLWIGCQNEYLKNHTNTKTYILFNGDPYKNMFFALFCENKEQLQDLKSGGLFPELELNFKEYLENYFNIDLTL